MATITRDLVIVVILALLCQTSFGLKWSPSDIERTFKLPLTSNPSSESTSIKKSVGEPNSFTWTARMSGACSGITISPSRGSGPGSVSVVFNKNYFTSLGTFVCRVRATSPDLKSSTLTITIKVVSDLCNYHANPDAYCEKQKSSHSYCDKSSGKCLCDPDYYGSSCATYCTNSTCSNQGTCSFSGKCLCQPPYYGSACNVFCLNSLNCSSNGVCNKNGRCNCDTNFYGPNCSVFCNAATNCSNAGTCNSSGSCQCNKGYYGEHCQYKQCPTCSTHGKCNNGTGICECDANYYGLTCDTYCDASVTCQDHGTCNNATGNCDCQKNWFGSNCTNYCDAETDCHGNGVCNDKGLCTCNQNYVGLNCTVYCNAATNCSNNGFCNPLGTGCECFSSYYGNECQYKTCPNCSVHGTCNNSTGLCECETEFYGKTCDVFCNATTCGDYGRCSNETGLCLCQPNFIGPNCICPDGFFDDKCRTYCVANITCNNRGYCDQSGHCVCTDSAYFGDKCSVHKLTLGLTLGISGLVVVGTIVMVVVCKKRKSKHGYTQIQDKK